MKDVLLRIQECTGKPVAELIPHIFDLHPDFEALRVVAYRPAPNLGERIGDTSAIPRDIIERAASLHETSGIGFWDAVFGMALREGALGQDFVSLAMLHDAAPDEQEHRLTRSDWKAGRFSDLASSLGHGYGLAISSRVEMKSGDEAHLPMLDFRNPHSETAVMLLQRICAELGQKRGVIARSPRSYHYYGLDPLTSLELQRFLARALLVSPIVDARYIAHRMLDGACRLRISAARGKGNSPIVEALWRAADA